MKYNRLKRRPLLHYLLFLGLLLLQIVPIHAQVNPEYQDCTNDPAVHPIYSSWNLPSTPICAGDNITFSIGYSNSNDIVIKPTPPPLPTTPDTVFIGDGQTCDSCYYRSYITFPSSYTRVINSIDDIEYVRLNIEHQYADELYIRLICPNGNEATILNSNYIDESGCGYALIPPGTQWQAGDNVNDGPHFGIHNGEDGTSNCDPAENPHGVGWNCCWSSNTNYTNVGYIYRSGHTDSQDRFLATNIETLSPLYRPDEPFSSLINCPIAGPWYIEIVDGSPGYNGYLFDWEIVFDESVLTTGGGGVDSAAVLVPNTWIEDPLFHRLSDTSFSIVTNNIITDTTIRDTLRLYNSQSHCWYDTTLVITVLVPGDSDIYATICHSDLPYSVPGTAFHEINEEGIYKDTLVGMAHNGCDSIITLHLTVIDEPTVNIVTNPSNATICEGESITLAAECNCKQRIFEEGFTLLQPYCLTTCNECDYSSSRPDDYGSSCDLSLPANSSRLPQFPTRFNTYPVYGGDIRLGKGPWTTPEECTGSITSITQDLSKPFKITLTANGWGDEPGKITVCVDGIPQQSFKTIHNEWGSSWPPETNYTLYFPAATNSSTITIKTDTIIKPNGDVTGYRAFIGWIEIKSLCHNYSWSTGAADTNAIITVQPEDNESYSVTVTNSYGCSASATHNVTVNHPHGTSETQTACGSYTWNGETYNTSGRYYYTHTDENGCEQVDTLNLTINENPEVHISGNLNIVDGQSTTLTASPADAQSYLWSPCSSGNCTSAEFNTGTIYESTTYTVTVTAANGCTGTSSATVTVTLCESWQLVTDASQLAVGDKIVIAAKDYAKGLGSQNNNYREAEQIQKNSDGYSLENTGNTQQLTVVAISPYIFSTNNGYLYYSGSDNSLEEQNTISNKGKWNVTFSGNEAKIQNYTYSGRYLQYNPSAPRFACYNNTQQSVSIYKLYAAYSDTTVATCNSFTLHDNTFTSSGNYSVVLSNAAANGCDSTIYLHLTIQTEVHGPDTTAEACESFTWHGVTYNTSGDKEYHTTTAAGCDSIVTLHLTIKEFPSAQITTSPATPIICEGESIILTGTTDCNGTEVILEEGFDGLGYGNTSTSGSNGPDPSPLTLPSNILSDTFISGNNVYAAGNSVKLGASKKTGSITSKEINLTQNFTVIIRAKGWVGTSTSSTSIKISATHCSSTYSFTVQGSSTCSFSEYQHNFNAATTFPSQLTIETTGGDKRAFIDYVKITKNATCDPSWYTSSEIISSNQSITVSPHSTTWYYFSVTSPNGCVGRDSVQVIVNEPTTGDTSAVVCDSFDWYEHTNITQTCDNLTHTFTNAAGCDSIVTLHLTVMNEDPATVTFNPGNGSCDVKKLTEEDCLAGIILPAATSCAPNYEFAGWTTVPITSETTDTPDPLLPAGSNYNPSSNDTLYAVYQQCDTIDGPYIYQLVTSDTTDWTGEYLIVNTEHQKIWNQPTHNEAEDAISVGIINHKITFSTVPEYRFLIGNTGNGLYSIQNNNGYYIGKCADNARNCIDHHPVSNIINFNNGNVNISVTAFPDCFITYRSDVSIFGYFARNYSNFYPIQLYRLIQDETIVACTYTSYPFYPSASSTVSACESYTWHRDGAVDTTITNSGTYLYTHTEDGCVYVDTLHLTIRHGNTGDTTAFSCDNFTWYGETFHETPTVAPTHTFTNASGCDSVVTLHLTIINEETATVTFYPGNGICNGSCEASTITEPDCLLGITLPTATPCNSDYSFAGWTTSSIDGTTTTLPSPLYVAGERYNPSTDINLYAVYKKCSASDTLFTLVTADREDWSGEYLIVSSSGNICFNGALTPPSLTSTYNNSKNITISGSNITLAGNPGIRNSTFLIAPNGNFWSICSKSGFYIYPGSPRLNTSDSPGMSTNTLTYVNSNSTIIITCNNLGFKVYDGRVFNYYNSSSSSSIYENVKLYRIFANENCEYTSKPYITHLTAETACESYLWHREGAPDTTIRSSGIYLHSYKVGCCEHVDTLRVTISHASNHAVTVDTCDWYTWRGHTYYASGDYMDTLTDGNGCTQVDTLHLTIYHANNLAFHKDTCDWYTWRGKTYYASGDYLDTLTDGNGCTQVDTLHLTIYHATNLAVTVDTCDWYTWRGKTYYASGDYMDTLTDGNGCTQVDTLHLTINHANNLAFHKDTCDWYTWRGKTYYASGDYMDTLTDGNGCTQVDTLHLTIYHATNLAVTVDTCDWYTWRGKTYYASGDYMDTLTDGNGCTQVDTLHLTVNKSSRSDTTVITCEAIEWHGQTYTESGNYKDTLTNAAGCDSIITLHLSITEVNISINASADTICAGEVDTLWVERVSPIAIGDILCTDNSFVKPVDWTEAAAMGKVALGIVFYVDNTGEHGWAVHLHNSTSTKKWTQSSYYADISLFNYPNAREAIKDLDGYNNTQRIRTASNNTQYPADAYPAVYAVDFEHGWYLPAAGQLRLLFAERHTINASLEAVSHTQQGVTPIADTFQYWSSTECNRDEAWGVTNSLGWVRNTSKNEYNRTCSVRNF